MYIHRRENTHKHTHIHSLTDSSLTHTHTPPHTHIFILHAVLVIVNVRSVEGAPRNTLLSTSRFLMHPVKCLYCSCGYSYGKFSLTPPSCRTRLPFRYLEAESNSKYTKTASQKMNKALTPSLPNNSMTGEKGKTHTHYISGCFLPLQDMNFGASIFWVH